MKHFQGTCSSTSVFNQTLPCRAFTRSRELRFHTKQAQALEKQTPSSKAGHKLDKCQSPAGLSCTSRCSSWCQVFSPKAKTSTESISANEGSHFHRRYLGRAELRRNGSSWLPPSTSPRGTAMHRATSITDRYPPRVGAHRWLPRRDGALPYSSGLLEGAFPHAPAPQKHPDQHTAPELCPSSGPALTPRAHSSIPYLSPPFTPFLLFPLFPKQSPQSAGRAGSGMRCGAVLPSTASSRARQLQTVWFNPPWASAQTQHR